MSDFDQEKPPGPYHLSVAAAGPTTGKLFEGWRCPQERTLEVVLFLKEDSSNYGPIEVVIYHDVGTVTLTYPVTLFPERALRLPFGPGNLRATYTDSRLLVQTARPFSIFASARWLDGHYSVLVPHLLTFGTASASASTPSDLFADLAETVEAVEVLCGAQAAGAGAFTLYACKGWRGTFDADEAHPLTQVSTSATLPTRAAATAYPSLKNTAYTSNRAVPYEIWEHVRVP